jgi:hypothetical protein
MTTKAHMLAGRGEFIGAKLETGSDREHAIARLTKAERAESNRNLVLEREPNVSVRRRAARAE